MHQVQQLLEARSRRREDPSTADVLQQSTDSLRDNREPDLQWSRSPKGSPLRTHCEGAPKRRDFDTDV
jgi:hypothetical protein